MRATAYVRVSSDQQDGELQREAIQRAASSRGDKIGQWFEEKESSQRRDGAQLTALRSAVSRGEVRRIYVYALDRLSRMGVFSMFRHIELFRLHGVELISLRDGFDFSGPAADLLVAAFAWCAEQERKRLRERMADARIVAEKKGKRWGRPRRVDPTTLAAARNLRKEGLTIRVVAARLKIPKATLLRALHGKGHYASKK